MKKGSFDFSSLVCLECGNIFTIPRKNVRTKSNGHIKDLWCPICKNVNKHYEVRDIDSFLYNLEYNINLSLLKLVSYVPIYFHLQE